ncbi:MAG: hypothetical protein CL845_03325 [Crocinitomicaceae bacterium]|nr:hypothetical protein [Crocinitomicaceae bacterium]
MRCSYELNEEGKAYRTLLPLKVVSRNIQAIGKALSAAYQIILVFCFIEGKTSESWFRDAAENRNIKITTDS